MSERVIEPCPFCGDGCTIENLGIAFFVHCDDNDCVYCSSGREDKSEAIAVHNELCVRLRQRAELVKVAKQVVFNLEMSIKILKDVLAECKENQ